MISRKIHELVQERLNQFPAVALLGPRQSGKTTFSKSLSSLYFDLEQEADRLNLDLQWNSLVPANQLIILDEAQEWPEIFKRLRGTIDSQRKRNGRFLLLGSVSPVLMKHVSESLAGRMALVELSPFLWNELPVSKRKHLWFYGGYPDGGILQPGHFPQWQINYLEILASRDLPNWGLPASPQTTMRLLRMLAVVHGQMLNSSQIGRSLDNSYKTIQSYMDYLEGTFLIRRIQSFHKNLKKRLVKSPKIYYRDSGILHALLNVKNEQELLNQPWVGASWEGFIIEQIVQSLKLAGKSFAPYFLRTSDNYEIDLLLDFGTQLWAIEIKLTTAPSVEYMQRLNKAADLVDASKRILISRTSHNVQGPREISCNLQWFLENLIE